MREKGKEGKGEKTEERWWKVETNKTKTWWDAPPCGHRRKQQKRTTIKGERGVRKWCQTDCEREKRKKGEIITHRATCKTKYHLFVYKCTEFRVILLLTSAAETNFY